FFRGWFLCALIAAYDLIRVVTECRGTCRCCFAQPSHPTHPTESQKEKHNATESSQYPPHRRGAEAAQPGFFSCINPNLSRLSPAQSTTIPLFRHWKDFTLPLPVLPSGAIHACHASRGWRKMNKGGRSLLKFSCRRSDLGW